MASECEQRGPCQWPGSVFVVRERGVEMTEAVVGRDIRANIPHGYRHSAISAYRERSSAAADGQVVRGRPSFTRRYARVGQETVRGRAGSGGAPSLSDQKRSNGFNLGISLSLSRER